MSASAASPLSDGGGDSCSGPVPSAVVAVAAPTGLNGVTASHPALIAPTTRKPRRAPEATGRDREARGLQKVETLIAQGQTDKAIDHLRKLITALPDSTRGHLRIASLLHEKRQSTEAVDILRTVIRRAPAAEAAAREVLAEICLEVGRPDEAIEHSRAILQKTPRSLFARDVLSAAYLQCGRLDESLRVIQEMIQLDPLDAANHFKKGVLLQQKGQLHAATVSFMRVLQMDSDSEAADESRAALEMLDGCQIRQIIMLAVEDVPFRLRLRRQPEEAVIARGFLLSDYGLAALSQMRFDDLPDSPPGWQQYYYN
jgi:tetratricopeptide (TPR) repeat protein